MIDGEALPGEFFYVTQECQGINGLDEAKEWIRKNVDRKPLIIVDTLEKVRGKRSGNAYQDNYAAGALSQSLVAPGGAAIAVHHNRKNGTSEDFVDDASGTLGLTGPMDTIIILKTQARHERRDAFRDRP